MPDRYDAILIGAGHNGLVTAALLSKAGLSVLVLERRKVLGGAAATEELFPGFRVNSGADDAGLLRPEVIRKLELERNGLELIESPVLAFAPHLDGPSLSLWRDPSKSISEIARLSAHDARRFPDYCRLVQRLSAVLDGMMTLTPPRLSNTSLSEIYPWMRLALKLKGLGKREMMEFMRVLPLPVYDFLQEWFESPLLQGLLGSAGVSGIRFGPRASGTSFLLLYNSLNGGAPGGRASRFVRGGVGRLSEILARIASKNGARIRTESNVARILIDDEGRAAGVALRSGEEFRARSIVSSADPKHTLLKLLGPAQLDPRAMRRVRNIRLQGTTAKLLLALDHLPRFTNSPQGRDHLMGHIVIAPSLNHLERASDDAKYGRISQQLILDAVIPTLSDPSLAAEGKHILSVAAQHAPYRLKDGSWADQGPVLADRIIGTLAQYAPGLPECILHQRLLTPEDWELQYGLSEGSIHQGEMGLDQMLFMRPMAGCGQYRSPVDGLYLCGAGTHPGGGVTGAPGFNAAREVLKDRKKKGAE
ncbi:MAG: NAD(P)/FAD-dependent oxidoreductase [Acidobacteriota bacterium]